MELQHETRDSGRGRAPGGCYAARVGLEGLFRRGVPFPHRLAWLIDNPLRRLWLSPEAHADYLALEPSWRALEIGPGSGFYGREVARRLSEGELVLLDLSPEMLAKARRKLQRAGRTNVRYVAADATRLPFERELDLVYMVAVLGEIPDAGACLRSIRRALRDGRRLAITEQRLDPDYEPFEELVPKVEAAGFELEARRASPLSYTATFRAR